QQMRLVSLLLGAACLVSTTLADSEHTTFSLLTPNYTEINRGGTLVIKCEFFHVDAEDVIIWKRGAEPLFMDFDSAISDDRYEISADEKADGQGRKVSELTIRDIAVHEDNTFYCGTMETDRYLGTRVRIRVPPTAHISPEIWPYTVLNLEPVTLRCTVTGNPTPKITWSKEGGSIASHVSVEGDTLRIPSVKKSDSGVYLCHANSTAGEATSRTDMRVHDPHVVTGAEAQPWIRSPVKYAPVEMNGQVNISCQYDGNPSPQIEWLFNGARLTLSKEMVRNNIKQYASRLANYSESTLQINEATAEYFGDYSCRASNMHGIVSTAIFVTAFPSPPELSIDDNWILTMTAMAPNGIHEFALWYRRPDESGWLNKKPITVNKGDQTGDKTWSKQINLNDFLDESGSYEIQVQAQNGYGYGNKASDMIRVTISENSHVPTASASLAGLSSAAALLLILAH
ncbi:hypothetical protein PENTCL1PPCAC_28055, partial [Pristionchus entomophagus]